MVRRRVIITPEAPVSLAVFSFFINTRLNRCACGEPSGLHLWLGGPARRTNGVWVEEEVSKTLHLKAATDAPAGHRRRPRPPSHIVIACDDRSADCASCLFKDQNRHANRLPHRKGSSLGYSDPYGVQDQDLADHSGLLDSLL